MAIAISATGTTDRSQMQDGSCCFLGPRQFLVLFWASKTNQCEPSVSPTCNITGFGSSETEVMLMGSIGFQMLMFLGGLAMVIRSNVFFILFLFRDDCSAISDWIKHQTFPSQSPCLLKERRNPMHSFIGLLT